MYLDCQERPHASCPSDLADDQILCWGQISQSDSAWQVIASSYATRIESGPPAVLSEFPFTLCAFIFSEVDQSRYYKRHTENPGLKSMENQQK